MRDFTGHKIKIENELKSEQEQFMKRVDEALLTASTFSLSHSLSLSGSPLSVGLWLSSV